MMPRWDDAKIAVEGAVELKQYIDDPIISWFENSGEADKSQFDIILDVSRSDGVYVIVDNNKSLVRYERDDKISLIKSLFSLFIDFKIVDVDYSEIKETWGERCTYRSVELPLEEAKTSSEKWVRDSFRDCCGSMLIHLQGDFTFLDMSDIFEKIESGITKEYANIDVLYSAAYSELENIRISIWYRQVGEQNENNIT